MPIKTHSKTQDESALRQHLNIPADAERVLLFAESSHWDPNWLLTSEDYYVRFVDSNLDLAIAALLDEPRRVYSVECMFFLRLYWERRPEQREIVRRLVNEGRLRLTSSGVTTADTLLPSAEAILRDLLIGQEWLRGNGMVWEPELAYFTDSFGCTPALPSLLRAAGFDRTAITRIDGMYFVGADWEGAQNFPRPGSSAAHLLEEAKTLDFIWRDMNGAEVLCHWNAFTYGQGDMLAHRGITRMYLIPIAFPNRSERYVADRIGEYTGQLAPLSRTPYLFCPIGFDFVKPLPDLVALLDRYNRVRYPTTGVWAVNAGLDDYLALVECHREQLPVVELDPNPYWTGFYTTRPALKKQCRELVERLLLAEQLVMLPKHKDERGAIIETLEPAWWHAVVSNHHDFITGTSPDKVVEGEQLPWLAEAKDRVDGAIRRLAASLEVEPTPEETHGLPAWEQRGGVVRVETPHYRVELSETAGGCIVEASGNGAALVKPSNDLISYRDSGGLWRMGHEYKGGYLRQDEQSQDRRAALQVRTLNNCLEVACDMIFDGEPVRRTLWFYNNSPLIYGRVEGRAAPRRTISLRFTTNVSPDRVVMAQPGGVVERPLRRWYDPTFWPVQQFVHVQDREDGHGMAIFFNMPGAVACRADGQMEAVALRNATRERAWRVVPLLAAPASGYEKLRYAFDYAVLFTGAGDWQANKLAYLSQHTVRRVWDSLNEGDFAGLRERAMTTVAVEAPGDADVMLAALKPAARGEGVIVRLTKLEPADLDVSIGFCGRAIQAAFLCDARERDLEALVVRDGRAHVKMAGAIVTVRVIAEDK